MYDKIKHLEFVENIITRANSVSSKIKGWCVTVLTGLLALYANSTNNNIIYLYIAIIPTILFGSIDTYYLKIERNYRNLYSEIIKKKNKVPDYSMNPKPYKTFKETYLSCICSPSIWLFYLPIIVGLIIAIKTL